MRAAVQVELPEAPPQTYLAWVDWWRGVERVIRRLELMTSAGRGEGPMLLHGPVPGYDDRHEQNTSTFMAFPSVQRTTGPAQRAPVSGRSPVRSAKARTP